MNDPLRFYQKGDDDVPVFLTSNPDPGDVARLNMLQEKIDFEEALMDRMYQRGVPPLRFEEEHNPRAVPVFRENIAVPVRHYHPEIDPSSYHILAQHGTDSVPAMLTPHEAVLNVGAADILGRDKIRELNAMGQQQMYQQGTEDANMTNPLEYEKGTEDVEDNFWRRLFDISGFAHREMERMRAEARANPPLPTGGLHFLFGGTGAEPTQQQYYDPLLPGNRSHPVYRYQLGTDRVWSPIWDPNDPRLRDTPLNEPVPPTTAATEPEPAPEPAPAFTKHELARDRTGWSPFDLATLPLSAYTPGRGDPKMEGGFRTATPGVPMYTYEMWKRGEAPYVTAAITGPGARPQPGSLVYRQIGNEIVPTRPTDRGPGVPGDPFKYDIAYENPAYATNYPYQGQTGAYGYGGSTQQYAAPTTYAARGGGFEPMAATGAAAKPEGFDYKSFGGALTKIGQSYADQAEASIKQAQSEGMTLLNSSNPYINQDPLALIRSIMQFRGGG